MSELLRELIRYSPLVTYLSGLVAVIRFRRLSMPLKFIAGQVIVSCLTELLVAVIYFLLNDKQNNLLLLPYYSVFESFLVGMFYYLLLREWSVGRFIPPIIGLLVLMNLVFAWFFQGKPPQFNTYARTLEGVCYIIAALVLYAKILAEMQIRRLEREPIFWINTGYLLYFSGSVFLFTMSNFVTEIGSKDPVLGLLIWALHSIFCITLYSLIAIGLWIKDK